MVPTPTKPRTRASHRARRNPRLRLACLRCQRRKIRCDGELPSCKNCQNAGTQCADGESARLKDLPRAYIVNLRNRVTWLESIIEERCPDVDLSEGPDVDLDGDATQLAGLDGADIAHTPLNQVNTSSIINSSQIIHNTSPPEIERSSSGANALSHEIGLVSLGVNQDPRYIGPSSGHLLARVMLRKYGQAATEVDESAREQILPTRLVEAIRGPIPLPSREMADQLVEAYFEMIHFQHPVLHKPSFIQMLGRVYSQNGIDPIAVFQVYMVLAIGATALSGRLRAQLPGESYALSALEHFHRLNLENSLQGLQCLILLLIFAIHSPATKLNVWYLSYHCIAAVLDLGLQRDITTQSGISLLEQEMRTRIFWVVLTFDRTIATMMGRPIGLRDEGCELRLPQEFEHVDASGECSDPMTYSVHLFRLTKLNSEIKYIAQSVVRHAPGYAYPIMADIHNWQSSMLQRLDEWASHIPSGGSNAIATNMDSICRLRYHSLRMLLLRPSPAIPKPSKDALGKCYQSAYESIRLYDKLYRRNLLVHSWISFHSLVLSTLTMLYCVKVVPTLSQGTDIGNLMGDLSIGLSILSATGEHWSGAKRCRDILDDLGRSTIHWLQGQGQQAASQPRRRRRRENTRLPGSVDENPSNAAANLDAVLFTSTATTSSTIQATYNDPMDPFADLLVQGSFEDYFEATEMVDVDDMMKDLFQDFISTHPTLG